MNDIVSIIIPTYKGSKIISNSIESLIRQSYQEIEIIVIDDNGEGTAEQIATKKAIQRYIEQDKIKYIKHKTNKNGSTARNTGIKNSIGSYIAFLDDDDIFLKDKIEKQVNYLKSNKNCGMVYTGLKELYKDGKEKIIMPQETKDFLFDYLCGKLYVCSSSILIRRDIVNSVGYWDESFKRHQDLEYICRVAEIANIGFLKEALVIKKIENRNLPTNPYKIEEYRLHFLKKMDRLISKYDMKHRKDIIFYNYFCIGKGFLKNLQIKKSLNYAFKSKRAFKMFFLYVKNTIKYFGK